MFTLVMLRTVVFLAAAVQIVSSLDMSHEDPNPDLDACPAIHATSEPTSPRIPPQRPKCQCDCNNGDCDSMQKALKPCGYVVYYCEQKDLIFSSDDVFYQARCRDQLDCAESIQCFVTCCLQAKGAEFMKRMLRGAQFEVLDACHPNADPKLQKEFKERTDCSNAIWPEVYRCVVNYNRRIWSALTQHGPDLSRFCCSLLEVSHCLYSAAEVESCNHHQRLFYKKLAPSYTTDAYRLICPEGTYSLDSAPCNCLPPLDTTGPLPPSVLEVFLGVARAITNSTNEHS